MNGTTPPPGIKDSFPYAPAPQPASIQPQTSNGWAARLAYWWMCQDSRSRTAMAVGVFLLFVGATALPPLLSGSNKVIKPPREMKADPTAVINVRGQDYEQIAASAKLQMEQFQGDVQLKEAKRLIDFAVAETAGKGVCGGQSIHCTLDRLETEAIQTVVNAQRQPDQGRQYQMITQAIGRIQAIDIARATADGKQGEAVIVRQPMPNVLVLSLQNRLQAGMQIRAASAEAIAGELVNPQEQQKP